MSDKNRGVYEKTTELRYAHEGVSQNLFTLPKNARVLFFLIDVDTAFDDTGTDLLDLGKAGLAEFWAADVDLSSAGQVMVQQSNLGDVGSNPVVVTGLYTGQNNNATAGIAKITCVYSHWRNR